MNITSTITNTSVFPAEKLGDGFSSLQDLYWGPGHMAQRLRTLVAFPERTWVWFPKPTWQPTTIINSTSRKSDTPFWPPKAPGAYMVHRKDIININENK